MFRYASMKILLMIVLGWILY